MHSDSKKHRFFVALLFAAGDAKRSFWDKVMMHFEGITMSTKQSKFAIDERIKLVEEWWDSIAPGQKALALADEQKAELDSYLTPLFI